MLKFLNKSYPFNDDLKSNAKIVIFISVGIFIILLFFQPIAISHFSLKKIFYLVSGLTITTFLILTINLILLPSLFPKMFVNSKWDIKREILWNIWILLAISSSNLLFYSQILSIEIHFSDIGNILLLGFISVAVLITINHNRLLRSHLKSAQQLNKKLIESKQQKEKLIHFESDYKNDSLFIEPNSLILIKSADNYIEVYYKSDEKIKKQMIRSSLDKANITTKDYDFVFKCHRSYIVNINHIKEIQGNSQGFILFFENLDFPAYVSQKYISEFQKLI